MINLKLNGWDVNLSDEQASLLDNVKGNTCPPVGLVFRALESVRPSDVKVIILGQDPYHTKHKASGLAFGYHKDYKGKVNSSLLNIKNELKDCGYDLKDLSLESLAAQGVLLLNTQLTVQEDKPLSHAGIWDNTIHDLLLQVNRSAGSTVVWLAWGAEASRVAREHAVSEEFVIETSHPCKYSANTTTRNRPAFVGSRCFTDVNNILIQIGREPIQWGEQIKSSK